MTAIPAPAPPRIGRIRRLRLLHPVRFYVWPALALLLVVLVVPAVAAGAWLALAVELPALGLVAAAAEAARASTMTPADVLLAMRADRG